MASPSSAPFQAKSVTHVSGTFCYLCLGTVTLASIQTTVGSNWLHLVYGEGCLQLVDRVSAALERSPGIDVFVYINGVPHLLGADMRINVELLKKRAASTAQKEPMSSQCSIHISANYVSSRIDPEDKCLPRTWKINPDQLFPAEQEPMPGPIRQGVLIRAHNFAFSIDSLRCRSSASRKHPDGLEYSVL